MKKSILFIAVCIFTCISCVQQGINTTTVNTFSPFLPTNYDEPYRPQFHYSQQSGWMNDINGVWYLDGVYHVTNQSFPYGLDWNSMHWAYATSPDLIHWKQQSPILIPEGQPNANVPGDCFSGSAVIDFNNTSGFGTTKNPPIVAIYTATGSGTCLAYSLDKGLTWTPYAQNPVNVAGPNADTRDPHVLWHKPTKKWVCVIFENGFTFYNSPDLKTWTKTGNFGDGWGWECPDFFELAVDDGATKKWVLLRADGQYYVGDFDGATFTPDAGGPFRMVYNEGIGGGFYASQTFFPNNFPGGKIVQMAWMSGKGAGSASPWTHNSTFPVEVKLKTLPEGIRVTRNPIPEIKSIYQSTETWKNQTLQAEQNLFAGKLSKCFDLEVVLDVTNATATKVNFQFADRIVDYNLSDQTCIGQSLKPINNQVKLRFLVDWGELEIFGNDGAYSYAENYWFKPSNHLISMTANGNVKLVSARLSNLDRIWPGLANNTFINDASSETQYGGNWSHGFEGRYYNNDRSVASEAGSYVECAFTGKQISWYGLKNDDLGMASVYIDDKLIQDDIDCYSTIRVVQQLFTKTDLTDGAHKIKVVLKGTRNPDSKGIALVHDYFGFIGKPGVTSAGDETYYNGTWTAIDDTSASTAYNGEWKFIKDGMYYDGTCSHNLSLPAGFEQDFTGTQISWYGLKNSDLGMASVYIDGELVQDNIDCYSTDRRVYQLFNKTGLSDGNHTIKVVVKDTKNPASSGYIVVHDYFITSADTFNHEK
jgi:sucrose-6-phosphate hydrolase SacC (GH32 family)